MNTVHLLRGGAPDKFNLYHESSYELIRHDNKNLIDFPEQVLTYFDSIGDKIISADEGDIKYANKLKSNHPCIILPRTVDGNIIDYDEYVGKDSPVYKYFRDESNIFKYAYYYIVSIDEFLEIIKSDSLVNYEDHAIKTTTGSGSRGVLLYTKDSRYLKYGMKYTSDLSINNPMVQDFIAFARKENCKIMIQKFIPFVENDLKKVNVDFVIRDQNLLGYKWTVMDQKSIFTNWDNGYHVRSHELDRFMDQLTSILVDKFKISDALMNFEAFSDMNKEFWLVEFNWRYSNSTFESQAAGIDMIDCYLNDKIFKFPMGWTKFNRYWQCQYYEDNKDIVNWN